MANINPHLDPRQNRRTEVKTEHATPSGVVRDPPYQSAPNASGQERLVQARPDRPQAQEQKPTRDEIEAQIEADRLRTSRIPSRCLKRKQSPREDETSSGIQNGIPNPPESVETRIKKEKIDEEGILDND